MQPWPTRRLLRAMAIERLGDVPDGAGRCSQVTLPDDVKSLLWEFLPPLSEDWAVVEALKAFHQDTAACDYGKLDISLRANREVTLAAVANKGDCLRYAAEYLRADKEVVLTAIASSRWAFRYVAKALLADKDVVVAAASQNARCVFAVAGRICI